MATYTNKSKQATSYSRAYQQGSPWKYDDSEILYESVSVLYNTFGTGASYTNKTFGGTAFITWAGATDTWADYTQSWENMFTTGATNYTNKTINN